MTSLVYANAEKLLPRKEAARKKIKTNSSKSKIKTKPEKDLRPNKEKTKIGTIKTNRSEPKNKEKDLKPQTKKQDENSSNAEKNLKPNKEKTKIGTIKTNRSEKKTSEAKTIQYNPSVITKGAFIIKDPVKNKINTIEFQINPEKLDRTLKLVDAIKTVETGKENTQLTSKFLSESFTVNIRLNSLDPVYQKKHNDSISKIGILPILSALEELMEPKELESAKNGKGELNPPKSLPQVIFYFGEERLWPVQIEGISIKEKQYFSNLIPFDAEVDVTMSVVVPDLNNENDKLNAAYKWMTDKRNKRAKSYYDSTTITDIKTKIF